MNQSQEITILENQLNQVKAEMQLRIIDLKQRLDYVKEENRQLKLSPSEINIINEKIKREARKWKRETFQVLDKAIERDRINIEMLEERDEQYDQLRTDHARIAQQLEENLEKTANWKDRYLAQVKINEMMARITVNGNEERLTSLPPPYIGHNDIHFV